MMIKKKQCPNCNSKKSFNSSYYDSLNLFHFSRTCENCGISYEIYNKGFERIEAYNILLLEKYGEYIVSNFTKQRNKKLFFNKDKLEVNKIFINYERKESEGCQDPICINKFGKEFLHRPMEFPSWLGDLDFSQENAKEFIIIGESISPQIKTDVNITFGLSNFPIDEIGKMNSKILNETFLKKDFPINDIKNIIRKVLLKENVEETDENLKQLKIKAIEKLKKILVHKLWEKMRLLFPDAMSFNSFTHNLYFTDLVKCNLVNNNIWKSCLNCMDNFLIDEIKLINPKKIIFLRSSSFDELKKKYKSLIKLKESCPTIDILENKALQKLLSPFNFRNESYKKKHMST